MFLSRDVSDSCVHCLMEMNLAYFLQECYENMSLVEFCETSICNCLSNIAYMCHSAHACTLTVCEVHVKVHKLNLYTEKDNFATTKTEICGIVLLLSKLFK